jgi:hypothetical protein
MRSRRVSLHGYCLAGAPGSFHGRARRACDFKMKETARGGSPTVSEGVTVAQTLVCDSPAAIQTEVYATKATSV